MDRNIGYLVPAIPPGVFVPKGLPLLDSTYILLLRNDDYVGGDYVDEYYAAENYVGVECLRRSGVRSFQ